MNLRVLIALLALMVLLPEARADALTSARRAQALLPEGTWSRVLRITNSGRRSPYPAEVHALVFEYADRLWFYTETDGTQSLSLHRGRLAEEKADLQPVLRAIDRGFTGFADAPPPRDGDRLPNASAAKRLPNGCFVESLSFFGQLCAADQAPDEANLLLFYTGRGRERKGHCVLHYRRGDAQFVYDPTGVREPERVHVREGPEPLDVARWVCPENAVRPLDRAVFVPLRDERPAGVRASGQVDARTMVATHGGGGLSSAADGAGLAPAEMANR
jgi:hypothetical protein